MILAALSVWSCENDDRLLRKEEASSISFGFTIRENGNSTKAAVVAAENVIRDVNIFVYNEPGHLVALEYVEDFEKSVSMDVNLGQEYSVYAIANVGDLSKLTQVRTLDGLKELEWNIADVASIVSDDGLIPFSGELLSVTPNMKSLVIPMTRLLAKFRVLLDISDLDANVTRFDVTRVRLRNINRRVKYFSESKAESTDDIISEGISYDGAEVLPAFSEGLDFYMPENAQGTLISGNSDEQSHIPGDGYMDLCTYVEFLVDYRSKTQYNDSLIYRYYLHDGVAMNDFDILRNTMYTCYTGFTGSGINETTWRIDVSGMKNYVVYVRVNHTSAVFDYVGQVKKFAARAYPVNAENGKLSWSSSDESVATVSDDGTVTATGVGECNIIVSATDGSGVFSTIAITVNADNVEIESPSNQIYVGIPVQLSLSEHVPSYAEVTWSTSNSSLAEISEDGLLSGKKKGRVWVYATLETGAKDSIRVNIYNPVVQIGDVEVYEGQSFDLNSEIVVSPDNNFKVLYEAVENPSHVTIVESGMLYAVERNTAFTLTVVKAYLADYPDIYTTFEVKVNPAIVALIDGDNRIVNTYGHVSDGRSLDGFKTQVKFNVTLAPDEYATWEVYKDGKRVYDVSVNSDYTLSALSATANGTYQVVGWNKTHLYKTNELTVEIYQYYDYEVGITNVSTYTLSTGIHNVKYYALSLHARWSKDSWERMGSSGSLFTDLDIVGPPSESNTLFYGINAYGSTSILYMNRYKTSIMQTGLGVAMDIEAYNPKSYLRGSFSDSSTAPVEGYTGNYYKLTDEDTGITGYYFIRQMNKVFYNISDW